MSELDHIWQTLSGSTYSNYYLVGNACSYEIGTGDNRGLKTGDTYLTSSSGSPATAWTQSYGYDANFDYLTSASYGDSQPHATQSWTYDAAGNRTSDYTGSSWTYDHLNRMTENGAGTSFSNDILGNRSSYGSGFTAFDYTWDCLNRLIETKPVSSSGDMTYAYRADGMRVRKINHSGVFAVGGAEIDDIYTSFRYDGQMPMQTFVTKADSSTVETDQGLGARGIDYVQLTTTPSGGSPSVSVSFPIYDAHGNEVASLSRSGSSYSLSNQRSYGAWGEIRQGATSGGPRERYCGKLGHVQDDETGLIYMRARYYEPGSGRFTSQDSGRQGGNWFLYCLNNPIAAYDESGKEYLAEMNAIMFAFELVTMFGGDTAYGEVQKLMDAMKTYIGLNGDSIKAQQKAIEELIDVIERFPAEDAEEARMQAELVTDKQVAVGLTFTDKVVGEVYLSEMQEWMDGMGGAYGTTSGG